MFKEMKKALFYSDKCKLIMMFVLSFFQITVKVVKVTLNLNTASLCHLTSTARQINLQRFLCWLFAVWMPFQSTNQQLKCTAKLLYICLFLHDSLKFTTKE